MYRYLSGRFGRRRNASPKPSPQPLTNAELLAKHKLHGNARDAGSVRAYTYMTPAQKAADKTNFGRAVRLSMARQARQVAAERALARKAATSALGGLNLRRVPGVQAGQDARRRREADAVVQRKRRLEELRRRAVTRKVGRHWRSAVEKKRLRDSLVKLVEMQYATLEHAARSSGVRGGVAELVQVSLAKFIEANTARYVGFAIEASKVGMLTAVFRKCSVAAGYLSPIPTMGGYVLTTVAAYATMFGLNQACNRSSVLATAGEDVKRLAARAVNGALRRALQGLANARAAHALPFIFERWIKSRLTSQMSADMARLVDLNAVAKVLRSHAPAINGLIAGRRVDLLPVLKSVAIVLDPCVLQALVNQRIHLLTGVKAQVSPACR